MPASQRPLYRIKVHGEKLHVRRTDGRAGVVIQLTGFDAALSEFATAISGDSGANTDKARLPVHMALAKILMMTLENVWVVAEGRGGGNGSGGSKSRILPS